MVNRVKIIPQFPHYGVTPYGDVYSKCRGNRWKKMNPSVNTGGYFHLNFLDNNRCRCSVRVHQFVMDCWGVSKPIWADRINHIDCNKLNNCVSNLEWSNAKLNSIHANNNGLQTLGYIKLFIDKAFELGVPINSILGIVMDKYGISKEEIEERMPLSYVLREENNS